MIRDTQASQLGLFSASDFQTPFGAGLVSDNRWVCWAHQIPWAELSRAYHGALKTGGRPAKPARLVIGALIIKHRLRLSDVETIEQLRENPYLQYFCGFERYQQKAAFAPTLFVKLRERLTPERFAAFEQAVIADMERVSNRAGPGITDDDSPPPAAGAPGAPSEVPADPAAPDAALIVDASVAEQQIRYPTDVSLLNQARASAEDIIDALWQAGKAEGLNWPHKPRTYRKRARRDFLSYSKRRRPSARNHRRARAQQLQYLRRDLGHIDALLDRWEHDLPCAGFPLPACAQYRLWVIRELTRQQAQMHEHNSPRIDDRIVSLHPPWVRPMVRGRLGHPVEFGSKFSVSLVQGIACVDALRWDAYGEAGDLIDQCQAYQARYGHYPAKVLADGIYGTRANRRWLKDRGITYGGKPLGRPPKRSPEQQRIIDAQRRIDACDRIPIEGKFGQGKAAYGLDKIPARRADTSSAWIRMIFMVMNLLALAKAFFWLKFRLFSGVLAQLFRSAWRTADWRALKSYGLIDPNGLIDSEFTGARSF